MSEKRAHSWVATIVALAVAAGGLVVANLMGWGTFFVFAIAGVILFFIVWVLYSQFGWRRAQVSLSTAVILMLVAGGLLWANMCVPGSRVVGLYSLNDTRTIEYGWPFEAFTQYKLIVGEKTARETIQPTIVINLAIALAILYAVWLMCDWRTRRRTARKSLPTGGK